MVDCKRLTGLASISSVKLTILSDKTPPAVGQAIWRRATLPPVDVVCRLEYGGSIHAGKWHVQFKIAISVDTAGVSVQLGHLGRGG